MAAAAVTLVMSASAFVAIRVAVASYSPGALALLRFAIGSTFIAAYAIAVPGKRLTRPRRADIPLILLTGLFGITIYHWTLNAGEQTVSAATASLLVNTAPIFAAIIAFFFLGEHLSIRAVAGIVLGFLGVGLVASGAPGGLGFDQGTGLLMIAGVAFAIYVTLQKPLLKRYTALDVTAWAIWSGTLFLAPFSPSLISDFSAATNSATLAVVYLGVFPAGVGYLTLTYVVSRLPVSRSSTLLYLVPPLALLIGWVSLGESLGGIALAGGGVVLASLALINTGRRTAVNPRNPGPGEDARHGLRTIWGYAPPKTDIPWRPEDLAGHHLGRRPIWVRGPQ